MANRQTYIQKQHFCCFMSEMWELEWRFLIKYTEPVSAWVCLLSQKVPSITVTYPVGMSESLSFMDNVWLFHLINANIKF